jgi:hypothetical protein
MATIKKYVDGGGVTTTKKTTKKPESTVIKPLAKKDRYSSLGGEIGQPPFGGEKPKPGTKIFNGVTGKYDITKKNGGAVKKAKSGASLGMKSVKAGYDSNPSVTRADIITAAKGKAKSGTKMKKAMMGSTMSEPMMKAGGKMKKCKYGCK